MTAEERFERIEQKIEFIVNQQAQFSADLQQEREERREREALLQQQLDRHQEQINKLNEAMVGMIGMMGRLSEAQAETARELKEIARELREGIRKLEEKGAETEE